MGFFKSLKDWIFGDKSNEKLYQTDKDEEGYRRFLNLCESLSDDESFYYNLDPKDWCIQTNSVFWSKSYYDSGLAPLIAKNSGGIYTYTIGNGELTLKGGE